MDQNIRLLWAYDHPTTRYQEVNFYMDAGMEVVVSLGDPGMLRFDRDYHNETHPLYPDWRTSLTLPSSIVERLRKINLLANAGHLDPDDADLINRFIDVLIIPVDSSVIRNIMTWYKGYLLYRVMGAPDFSGLMVKLDAIEAVAAESDGRLYLAPGLKNVIPFGCPNLSRDVVYLNCWVSPERLNFRWTERKSRRLVSTAISYIDFMPFFAEQFENLKANLTAQTFVVVGKNDKESEVGRDPRVLGNVSSEELYQTLATSRVFVDAGTQPEHLVWPPLESMTMGVPVLFTRWSALTAAALDEGYSEADLAEAGMFQDFAAINSFLAESFDDFTRLRAIVEKQAAIFLNSCFSRDKAMQNMRLFLETVRGRRTRDIEALNPLTLSIMGDQVRRRAAEPPMSSSLSRVDGQEAVRLGRLLRPSDTRGETGRLEGDANGHFVLRVREGQDPAGYPLMDTLPRLDPGLYRLRVGLWVEAGRGELGVLAVGALHPKGYAEEKSPIRVSGPGYIEIETAFTVTRDDVGVPREVRLNWNGQGVFAIRWLQLASGAARR